MDYNVVGNNSVGNIGDYPPINKPGSSNLEVPPPKEPCEASATVAVGNYNKAAFDIQQKAQIKETLVSELGLKDETAIDKIAQNRDRNFNDIEISQLKDFLDVCQDNHPSIKEYNAAEIIVAAGNENTFGRKIGIATNIIKRFPGFVHVVDLTRAVKDMDGDSIGLLEAKNQYARYGKQGLPEDLVVEGLHYVKSDDTINDWQIG